MKVKALMKRVNTGFKIVSIEADTMTDVKNLCNIENVGYVCVGKDLYCYFEDCGWEYYENGQLQYNCDIDLGSTFNNRIFGDLIVTKVDIHGGSIDLTEGDIKHIKNIFFTDDKLNKSNSSFESRIGEYDECISGELIWGKVIHHAFFKNESEVINYLDTLCLQANVGGYQLRYEKESENKYIIIDDEDGTTIMEFIITQRGFVDVI